MSRGVYETTLFSAASATSATGTLPVYGNGTLVAIYVETSAGVTAGQVTIETAINSDYTGTWATLGTISTTVASDCSVYQVPAGAYGAIRVRISTAITGGTVTARALVVG